MSLKHNVLEATGHCVLLLTYTVVLLLKTTDDAAFQEELFPKVGYGFYLVFLYVVVLPAPIIYFSMQKSNGDEDMSEITSNPLLLDDEASGQEKSAGTSGTRPQVAKMQRQAKEQREKNKALTVEVLTLRKQVQDLGGEATKIASVVFEQDIEGVAILPRPPRASMPGDRRK